MKYFSGRVSKRIFARFGPFALHVTIQWQPSQHNPRFGQRQKVEKVAEVSGVLPAFCVNWIWPSTQNSCHPAVSAPYCPSNLMAGKKVSQKPPAHRPPRRYRRLRLSVVRRSPTIDEAGLCLPPSLFELRRTGRLICPTGKSVNCCLAPFAKIFPFSFYPNHFYIPAVSPHRGAYRDRHGRGAGCGGRGRRA